LGSSYRAIILYLGFLASMLLQACAPVRFNADDFAQSQLSCQTGHEYKCRVKNGWGVSRCAGKFWTECSPSYCDVGYALDPYTESCKPVSCDVGAETSCSGELNKNLDLVGIGLCNAQASGAESCKAWSCVNGSTKVGDSCSPDSCQPGEKKVCEERNGSGISVCGANGQYGTCQLTACEEGFRFDSDGKICESMSCVNGNDLACETQFGPGHRSCAGGAYSPFCTPNECPVGYEIKDYSCWPVTCPVGYIRNASGACEEKVNCNNPFIASPSNTCVCPAGTLALNGSCGTCAPTEIYEPANGGSCVASGCTLAFNPASGVIGSVVGLDAQFTNGITSASIACPAPYAALNGTIAVINGAVRSTTNIAKQATLSSSAISCTVTASNGAAPVTCTASLTPSNPPPSCTSITFNPNPAVYNGSASVSVAGTYFNNADNRNTLTCGGVNYPLTAGANADLAQGTLSNLIAGKSCTARIYQGTAFADCPMSNLTVGAPPPATCALTVANNPIPWGGNLDVSLTGTNFNASSTGHQVLCGSMNIPLLAAAQQSSTLIRASYPNANPNATLNGATCTGSVIGLDGNRVNCTGAVTLTMSPQPVGLSCTGITVTPVAVNSGTKVNITVSGTDFNTTATTHTIRCGPTPTNPATGAVANVVVNSAKESITAEFTPTTTLGQPTFHCSATVRSATNTGTMTCPLSNQFTVYGPATCGTLSYRKVSAPTVITTAGTIGVDTIKLYMTPVASVDPNQSVFRCTQNGGAPFDIPMRTVVVGTGSLPAGFEGDLPAVTANATFSCQPVLKNFNGLAMTTACPAVAMNMFKAPTCDGVTIASAGNFNGANQITSGKIITVGATGTNIHTTAASSKFTCALRSASIVPTTGFTTVNTAVEPDTLTGTYSTPTVSGQYECVVSVANLANYSVTCAQRPQFEIVANPTCQFFQAENVGAVAPKVAIIPANGASSTAAVTLNTTVGDNVKFRVTGSAGADLSQSMIKCTYNTTQVTTYPLSLVSTTGTSSVYETAIIADQEEGLHGCNLELRNALGGLAPNTYCQTRTVARWQAPRCDSMTLDTTLAVGGLTTAGNVTANNITTGDSSIKVNVFSGHTQSTGYSATVTCNGTTFVGSTAGTAYTVSPGTPTKPASSAVFSSLVSPLAGFANNNIDYAQVTCSGVVKNLANDSMNCPSPLTFKVYAPASCKIEATVTNPTVKYNTDATVSLFNPASGTSSFLRHAFSHPSTAVNCTYYNTTTIQPTTNFSSVADGSGKLTDISADFSMTSSTPGYYILCKADVFNEVGRKAQCQQNFYPTDNCRPVNIDSDSYNTPWQMASAPFRSLTDAVKLKYNCATGKNPVFNIYDNSGGGAASINNAVLVYDTVNANYRQFSSGTWNTNYQPVQAPGIVTLVNKSGQNTADFRQQILSCDNTPPALQPASYCGPAYVP
jgi:hypothetical protein